MVFNQGDLKTELRVPYRNAGSAEYYTNTVTVLTGERFWHAADILDARRKLFCIQLQ